MGLFQIGTNHPLLHTKALDLLIRLFESSYDELDVLVRVSGIMRLGTSSFSCVVCGVGVVSRLKHHI